MSRAALKRVENWLNADHEIIPRPADEELHPNDGLNTFTVADLRAIVALARQATDLRRRIRLARKSLDCPGGDHHMEACGLLNLRKPLPKGRRR